MKRKSLAIILSLCLILLMQSFQPAVFAYAKPVSTEKFAMARQLVELRKQKPDLDYIDNEVLVKAGSRTEAVAAAAAYGAKLKSFSENGYAVMILNPEQTVIEAIAAGASSTNSLPVVYPNYIYQINDSGISSSPDDPYVDYHNSNFQYFHYQLGNFIAWDTTTGSSDVYVAVIDTGVNYNHPDLVGRISSLSYNSYTGETVAANGLSVINDYSGHGSHVAGTIIASQNNGLGGSGIAPNVTLIVIKANTPDKSSFTSASIINGINYAVDNGASIINMSLGREFADGGYSPELDAIQNAVSHGVLVVCAAGNESASQVNYPAAYDECIAVSAVNELGAFEEEYSNFGSQVDIAAPGSKILSTQLDNSYWFYYGTSMAAPMVSAVAALIKSQNPLWTAEQIKQKLYSSSIDKGAAGFDNYYGNGVLNTLNALSSSYITVTFNSQGGSKVPSYQMASGSYLTAPVTPSRPGAAFLGWYTDQACTAGNEWVFSSYDTQASADTIIDNTTLYAKWDIEQVTVTFDSMGGSEVAPIITAYNSAITLPVPPSKTGFHFTGWNTIADGSGTALTESTLIADNLTVYAQWVINTYTVTFVDWDNIVLATRTANYNFAVDLPAAPTRIGYNFTSWSGPVTSVTDNFTSIAQYSLTPLQTVSGSSYHLDEARSIISNISAGTSVSGLISQISNPESLLHFSAAAGAPISDPMQTLSTGMMISLVINGENMQSLSIVVKGDITGDGQISALDLLQIKKQLLGQISLQSVYADAAMVVGNGEISALDLLQIKKHLLGQITIQ